MQFPENHDEGSVGELTKATYLTLGAFPRGYRHFEAVHGRRETIVA